MKNSKYSCGLSIFWLCLLLSLDLQAQDLNPTSWPHLTGYWKFQDAGNPLKATVGKNLELNGIHQIVSGASYGDTAIRIGVGSYYRYKHGIAPNGGGDSVNQYTLMYDFKILSLQKWHTFHQTDSTNKNDGECFIRPITESNPGRIGTAATKYSNDSVLPNVWYRLVVSVNLGHFYRYYLNGKLILEGDTQNVDGRFALLPEILFFADNNAEDDTIDVASLAIFDTCLMPADVARIGTIEPCIANPPKIYLGNDTSLCMNASLNLSAGTGHKSYVWSNGKKLPFAVINANDLGPGKHNVWVSITDVNGCSGSDTIQVMVNPLPTVSLGMDTAICGDHFLLTGGADVKNSYIWKKWPSDSIISQSRQITLTESGSYSVQVEDLNSCKSVDYIQVTLNSLPNKPVIASNGKPSFCEGDSIIVHAPQGFKKYDWNEESSFNPFLVLYDSDSLTLMVTDSNGCASPVSDLFIVTKMASPATPDLQEVNNQSFFCEGDSLKLVTNTGFSKYYWQDGEFTASRYITNGGSYSVSVEDSNGCRSDVSLEIMIKRFNKPAKPVVKLFGNPALCEGDMAILYTLTNAAEYKWSDGALTKYDSVYNSGSYKLMITDSNNCQSDWSDSIDLDFMPIPSKPVIFKTGTDTLTWGGTAQKYRWYRDGVLLNSDTASYLVMKSSGTYQLSIANQGCWSDLSDGFNYIHTGVSSSDGLKFDLYPNPANDFVHINLKMPRKEDAVILNVFNSEGERSLYLELSSDELAKGVEVDIRSLAQGWYVFILNTDDRVMRQPVYKFD